MHEDNQLIYFWQNILEKAISNQASDIHIEPDNGLSRIRLRVDGELKHIATSPQQWHEQICTRIKILSKLDISERRLPQDGQMRIDINHQIVDCRTSTLPTLQGEKVVIRLLNNNEDELDITQLGFNPKQLSDLKNALEQAQGFILVTGPTGSGKTQTLYSCIKYLRDSSKNINTIEDPIEIQLDGIQQVTINEKSGLSFDRALRAMMRQDPDVIMVGEIRDPITAETAFKAAETGHLVLSTLHANDAPSALWRLRHLGLSTDNLANNLSCITAQRLVRLICPHCANKSLQKTEISFSCSYCLDCGFKGRTAIHQVMPLSESIRELIESNAPLSDINKQCAIEDIKTLRESASHLIASGISSAKEIYRHIA